jgi:probable rRNA maturation factor
MSVEILIEDDRWVAAGLDALADRAVTATLGHLGLDPNAWDVNLLACDDTRIATLNDTFRDKPGPTNVLSWPSETLTPPKPGAKPPAPEGPDPELGDIAMAYDTCAREAEVGGLKLADHVTHLIVHGVLHLLGYDHIDDADAALMEGLETEILATLGVADPY